MKKVRKAVITAAGRGTRQYPASNTVQKEMFPLVDRDGLTKPTIQIIAEEALDSGIDQICIVTTPGDEDHYHRHFAGIEADLLPAFARRPWALIESEKLSRLEQALHYRAQESPEGFGHAVWCAREFVGDEPFLLLLGDHVYISNTGRRCARQLMDRFNTVGHTVSSVQRTPEHMLQYFGTLRGDAVPDTPQLYAVDKLIEKPSPDTARSELRVDGLAKDEYLCHFGMHVFTPGIMTCLDEMIHRAQRQRGEFQLTSAQQMLCEREPYYAAEISGHRYDMGIPFGYMETQMALALNGVQHEQVIGALSRIMSRSGPLAGREPDTIERLLSGR